MVAFCKSKDGKYIPCSFRSKDTRSLFSHPEGDTLLCKYGSIFRNRSVCPDYNSSLTKLHVFSCTHDQFGHSPCFFLSICKFQMYHIVSSKLSCLELFIKTALVVSDQPAGIIHDPLGRSVIILKTNIFTFRKLFWKTKHYTGTGTSESIYGLIIIPYDKKIIKRKCKHLNDFVLHRIDILKFINEYVFKSVSPDLKHIRTAYE